jgi:hypothetical protein
MRKVGTSFLYLAVTVSLLMVLWGNASAPALRATSSVSGAELQNPVARLARQIERGEATLDFATDGHGYLNSLLKNFDINVDSQVLVFSKTSLQFSRISPATPRAIYFNDSVSVGAVQNSPMFELTALDPTEGIVYYTMDTQNAEKPRFERRSSECLNCHGAAGGLVVSSVFPSSDGTPFVTGTFFGGVDHRTPLDKRWGGWYVTGKHGSVGHMGNVVAPDPENPFDLEKSTPNLTDLSGKFDVSKYLAPTSDIVALMTLEHQTRMTNLIISTGQQFRRASQSWSRDNSSVNKLDAAFEELVAYMFFADEASLNGGVTGSSTFTETFSQRGPRDKRGRSLRDFDLKTRLFRYPLSYMIYSEIFDAMPEKARTRVYQRLHEVLTNNDANDKFRWLSAADRRAILEVLRDTKSNLPSYWFEESISSRPVVP